MNVSRFRERGETDEPAIEDSFNAKGGRNVRSICKAVAGTHKLPVSVDLKHIAVTIVRAIFEPCERHDRVSACAWHFNRPTQHHISEIAVEGNIAPDAVK